eukprot:6915120-Prymnesium_polylepis.1
MERPTSSSATDASLLKASISSDGGEAARRKPTGASLGAGGASSSSGSSSSSMIASSSSPSRALVSSRSGMVSGGSSSTASTVSVVTASSSSHVNVSPLGTPSSRIRSSPEPSAVSSPPACSKYLRLAGPLLVRWYALQYHWAIRMRRSLAVVVVLEPCVLLLAHVDLDVPPLAAVDGLDLVRVAARHLVVVSLALVERGDVRRVAHRVLRVEVVRDHQVA